MFLILLKVYLPSTIFYRNLLSQFRVILGSGCSLASLWHRVHGRKLSRVIVEWRSVGYPRKFGDYRAWLNPHPHSPNPSPTHHHGRADACHPTSPMTTPSGHRTCQVEHAKPQISISLSFLLVEPDMHFVRFPAFLYQSGVLLLPLVSMALTQNRTNS